jgi:uncharacterized protein YegJ (DUF2314 family)
MSTEFYIQSPGHLPRFTVATCSALLTVFVFLSSCSKKAGQDAIPVGPPIAESIHFQYAVYMLPVHTKDPSAVLREVLVKLHANLKLVDQISKDPREMVVSAHLQKHLQQEYAPPSMEYLNYTGAGISSQQAQALQKSEEAFIFQFAHPNANVWTALRTADLLVEEVARKTGGLVWDEETREVFSPDNWHERRLKTWVRDVPDISSQTVVQTYKKDELVRAITLGMTKAGLPDVVMDDFPWSSEHQVGNLINLFCQSMAEGAVFEKSGKFALDLRAIKNSEVRDTRLKSSKENFVGVAYLSLKPGVWEEGDPKNRLIQITPDRYMGNDVPAKLDRMLDCVFGWEDKVTAVEHNEELLQESSKERAKLPGLQKDFNAGLPPGEFIQVKAPFKTPDGGNEWMWVEITSWKGNLIRGVLENKPLNIPDLHAGQIVEIWQGDVFDYIRQYSDEHKEGNTTGALLEKMRREEKPDAGRGAGSSSQVPFQQERATCRPD